METYEVRPAYAGGRKLNAAVSVPGSKSITNRALMLAALADGTTTLRGALMSDDSRAFIGCLQNLGFPVEADEEKKTVRVTGFGGTIPKKEASINVGSAGTAARFITALLGFVPGIWHLDASEQMKKRPMKPLLRSLETLGSRIEYHGEPGFFPFTIHSDGVKTDEVSVNIDDSSQFLSALMMASLTLKRPFVIRVLGSHGLSYVQMTVKLMRDFGAEVKEISSENSRSPLCLSISLPGQLRTGAFDVEPDVSAAAYFYACAAITGGGRSCLPRVTRRNGLHLFRILRWNFHSGPHRRPSSRCHGRPSLLLRSGAHARRDCPVCRQSRHHTKYRPHPSPGM